ncbi:MAG TPA: hypothetical protein VHY20_07905 [Pirellulales bacterium]|nr:hypothetical protein [Pirellulales bacterium]
MQHSNLYALDGLLILGLALVCVTIHSGLRGLYCRGAAASRQTDEDESGQGAPNPPSRKLPATAPAPRQAA